MSEGEKVNMTTTTPSYTDTLGVDTDYELMTPEGPVTVRGRLIGYNSSQREDHSHVGPLAPHDRRRCAACRWVEIRIVRDEDGQYAVSTLGRSTVDGEEDRSRVIFTESPFEILEVLTDRRNGRTPRLPIIAARVLAQAAAIDDGIKDAYVNRAVV